jgi:hypothetical protein
MAALSQVCQQLLLRKHRRQGVGSAGTRELAKVCAPAVVTLNPVFAMRKSPVRTALKLAAICVCACFAFYGYGNPRTPNKWG